VTMSVTIAPLHWTIYDNSRHRAAIPQRGHWTAEQYHKLVGTRCTVRRVRTSAGQERKEQAALWIYLREAVAGEWEIENVVVLPNSSVGRADELMRGLIQGRGMKARRRCCWKSAKRMASARTVPKARFSRVGSPPYVLQRSVGGRDFVYPCFRPLKRVQRPSRGVASVCTFPVQPRSLGTACDHEISLRKSIEPCRALCYF